MTRSRALTWLFALPLTIPLAAPLVGCADDGGGDELLDDGDTGNTNPGDGDGDSGDGDGDSGDGDGDSGDGDGDSGDGDGDSGDGDGDSGDGDGDSGDGDGDGDVDTSTYSAIIMPGGFDRITVTRINIDEPNCTRMVLYSPVMFDMFDIDIPDLWRIEEVMNWRQGWCPDDNANPHTLPDGGTGAITFGGYDALGTYPCVLNFDLELDMNSDPPSTTIWNTQGVLVEGVNCG